VTSPLKQVKAGGFLGKNHLQKRKIIAKRCGEMGEGVAFKKKRGNHK